MVRSSALVYSTSPPVSDYSTVYLLKLFPGTEFTFNNDSILLKAILPSVTALTSTGISPDFPLDTTFVLSLGTDLLDAD